MPTKKLRKNKANIRRKAKIDLIKYLIQANTTYIKKWENVDGSIKEWKALNPITYELQTINKTQIENNLIYAKQENVQLELLKNKIEEELEFL